MSDATLQGQDRSPLSRRRFLLGGGMLLTAAVAAARVPHRSIDLLGKRELEKVIPSQVGEWTFASNSGLVVPPKDQLSDQLYSQLLTRVYTAPDRTPVMLLIAQSAGQTGVLQVHRPEICYPVGGFTLTGEERHSIETGRSAFPAVAFTATSMQRVEQLIYWTRVGYDLPSTWLEQRLSVARANLRGDIPDAVLVRVSTVSPDREGSLAMLEGFSRELMAAVDPRTRTFLVGRS